MGITEEDAMTSKGRVRTLRKLLNASRLTLLLDDDTTRGDS